MSREIKFRAWLKSENCYLGKWLNTQQPTTFTAINDVSEYYGCNDLEVEQYTGLKDKNGKDIYEGDIVALLFGYVPMKSVTTENIRIEKAQKAVIHFDTARAAFRYTIKQRIPKDCQFKSGTKTNMVVIGNIHENPELLGGKE